MAADAIGVRVETVLALVAAHAVIRLMVLPAGIAGITGAVAAVAGGAVGWIGGGMPRAGKRVALIALLVPPARVGGIQHRRRTQIPVRLPRCRNS